MDRLKQNCLLRFIKLLNIIFVALPIYFYFFNNNYYQMISTIILFMFIILYIIFGKIYDAFYVSLKRVSELVYSQSLAALICDGIIWFLLSLLSKSIFIIKPFLLILFTQVMISFICCKLTNTWYFKAFPAKKTIIIYDDRLGLDEIIRHYGLDVKYNIQSKLFIDDIMNNLTVLREYQTAFLSGIHSKDRNILLKYCISKDIETFVIPRIGDVLVSAAKNVHMFHIPMLKVNRYDVTLEYLFVKRLIDIVVSSIACIILSPIMLITAIAIKAYDGGPAFYTQVRLTKDGKEFKIHKFRSMRVDAEKDGVARLSSGDSDDRITPIGKIIRKLRLDELPQLLNILDGSLTIVGPRPERPEIAKEYEKELPEFALRLQAKAGLTGYAQVYGKYNTTPYDKLMMDLMYIAHPSIIDDIRIMFATVKILFMSDSTEGVEEGKTTASR